MKTYVTKGGRVTFGPITIKYTIDLPAGLRVRPITEGGTKGSYFLDEFPTTLFPRNSLIRHDAEHYGVVLTPEEVEEQK